MMYGESDAATPVGVPPRRAPRPGAGVRLQGLERRRRRGLQRDHLRRHARSEPGASPRSIPRTSTTSRAPARRSSWSTGMARSIVWPAVELYEARVPRAPRDLVLLDRDRAVDALAHVHAGDRRARRGARHAARGHARRAARRRPAHPPGVGHRPGLRPRAGRRAWACRTPATRARPGSSASCTPPASRAACRRPACGPPCPTTSPPRPTRRPRWRSCASSRAWSASPSTPPSSRSASADYERQVNLAVQSDPDVQAFVERLEQAAGRGGRRARAAALGRHDRPRPPALPAPARRRQPADRRSSASPASDPAEPRPAQCSAAGHTSR